MANEIEAVVPVGDGPNDQEAPETVEAGVRKDGDTETDANAEIHDDETPEGRKKLGGWQRKLLKKDQQIEILVEALRKVGGLPAKAEAQDSAPPEEKPPVKPARPKMSDFAGQEDPWEKYDAALEAHEGKLDKYNRDVLAWELKQEKAKERQSQEVNEVATGWADRIAEAKKAHKDFEQVAFSEDTPMAPAMGQAIIDSDIGTEILYFLGQNQAEAERISKLSPIAQIREIGKIESRIADKNSVTEEEEKPTVATSTAPRPPSPVRRTTSTSQEPDDKDDYATWLRKREAQLKAK